MSGCENCKSPLWYPILQNYKVAPLSTNVWPTLNSPLAATLSSSLLSLSPLFTLSNFACVPVPYFSIIQTFFFNYVGHSEGEVQCALHDIKNAPEETLYIHMSRLNVNNFRIVFLLMNQTRKKILFKSLFICCYIFPHCRYKEIIHKLRTMATMFNVSLATCN